MQILRAYFYNGVGSISNIFPIIKTNLGLTIDIIFFKRTSTNKSYISKMFH